MGIQNLLKFLKPFIRPVHIKEYAGKRVGIDAYSWLHKGAYSCSMELCLDLPGSAGKRYLNYFMHHINLLRHYKITPVVVFDGGSIPCKSATEQERGRRRDANLKLAKEKLKQGNVTAATEFFRKAICITPSMAYKLIQILKSECVEFIVAPYEADAQLACLSALEPDEGGIAAVITEDSDLIAYGCQAIIFKMDRFGNGEEIIMDRIFNAISYGPSFKEFDKELFTGMCVLAGCDFLPSVPGIGVRRAYSLVSKYKNLDRDSVKQILRDQFQLAELVLSVLKFDKRYKVPEDYCDSFRKAVAVFHHARVYDAVTRSLKLLSPLEGKHREFLNGELDLLGPELPQSVAAAIAEGNLNPITMEEFDYISKVEICSGPAKMICPSFNYTSTDEIQISFTEESCIIMPSDEQTHGDNIKARSDTVVNQKYIKEALTLGMLAAPKECTVAEVEVYNTSVPDNNPFKKRKMVKSSHLTANCNPQAVAPIEDSLGIVCSSRESQQSVQSKPKKTSTVGKGKKQKALVKNEKSIKIEKSGILKIFRQL